jgi:predicted nicotinamide N-methyase
VGYYFHLADLKEGETVVDLGSGSGMDSFIAALKVARAARCLAST